MYTIVRVLNDVHANDVQKRLKELGEEVSEGEDDDDEEDDGDEDDDEDEE